MISATNINNQTSFTSVIPVRVFIDGLETTDAQLVKKSCRQLSNLLASPSKNDIQKEIMTTFAHYDKSYVPKFQTGYTCKPSEIFRCVTDFPQNFFITGSQAKELHVLGKSIGVAINSANQRGITTSFDTMVAKRNYGHKLKEILSKTANRLSEISDGIKRPLTLNLNMKSNEKYGLTTFKMQPDSINFNA